MLKGYKKFIKGLFYLVIGTITTWYALSFGAYTIIYFLIALAYLYGACQLISGIMLMFKKKYN